MNVDKVDINKLPSDVRKTFKQMQLLLTEKKIQSKAKSDFLSFVKCVWPEFVEGSHYSRLYCLIYRVLAGKNVLKN